MTREEIIAGLIGIAVMLGMRLLDYSLPKNHHFKFMERFIVDDKEEPEEE